VVPDERSIAMASTSILSEPGRVRPTIAELRNGLMNHR
jgi:hypothetical protein